MKNHLQQTTIRKAVYTDTRKMSAIENSAAELFSTLSLEFLQKLPEHIPPRNDLFYQSMVSFGSSWVISVNGELAGFICTEKISGQNALHIHEFAIARLFQGKGLGSILLRFVIDWACKKNIACITLTTFLEVQWNAPLYRKFGFACIDKNIVDERLQRILQEEVHMGLPRETRCAMALSLMESK